MFSPLNDSTVADWFRRLDAAWRRMPAEEQARQREEVQQHLEGLVAAKVASGQADEDAWNAALVQFGDPTQIGRKMYYEWRQSRTGFRVDMIAILFGYGLHLLMGPVLQSSLNIYFGAFAGSHGTSVVSLLSPIGHLLTYGSLIMINAAIGWKYPAQAIRGATYAWLLFTLSNWILVYAFYVAHPDAFRQQFSIYFVHSVPWMPLWAAAQVAVAYLASVTKRGWYKPTWEDFKLTWPKRRQISH